MADRELCPVKTYPGRYYEDPEPPEYCDNEVQPGHEVCPVHEDGGWCDE
jgi:hypothetical protein